MKAVSVLSVLALTVVLNGCVAVPVVAMANLAHKSGTMTVSLEGSGDAIAAFKSAAIRNGGTVPSISQDFARAEFSQTDIKIEAQVTGSGTINSVTLRGSSLSHVGRTYELKDNIKEVTERVAIEMQSHGFIILSSDRARGI